MTRVANGWMFASVMLLAAGAQLYSPALAAWTTPVRRALGMFDISIGGTVLLLTVLAKAAVRHAAKKRTEVERKLWKAQAEWLKDSK